MSNIGLRTHVGISSDDPKKERNTDLEMNIVLSAYGKTGLLLREVIDTLKPHQHKFYCLDDELEKLNIHKNTDLCVLHRVPVALMQDQQIPEFVDLPETPDFDMYRMVVQYSSKKGGKGGVIYETPPNFNQKRGDFLSFSNKIYTTNSVDTYLVFINYSTNRNYTNAAEVKLSLYGATGSKAASKTFTVPPFNYTAIDVKELLPNSTEKFFSFVASSAESSLIPLSINTCKTNGGVSVEHSHPPQAYIMAPWNIKSSVKRTAINYHI